MLVVVAALSALVVAFALQSRALTRDASPEGAVPANVPPPEPSPTPEKEPSPTAEVGARGTPQGRPREPRGTGVNAY